ncbi:MAG: hypothetical protein ABIT38_23920 [Gemmatimonadaceae bacterium]
MKRRIAPVVLVGLVAACAAPDNGPTAVANPASQVSSVNAVNEQAGPPEVKIFHARGFNGAPPRQAGGKRSPNMTNHGGVIMTKAIIQPIYWGPSWSNSTFVDDKITGLASFYSGWNNSHFANTNVEYSGSNGRVGAISTFTAGVTDLSNASGGGSSSAILAAVCRNIPNPDQSGNGYYPVYTDIPRGNAGYCAWHSAGTCFGVRVQFAFFWKLDGDSGCDPVDGSGLHTQGLAALANVTAHELSEAVTDPANPGAWYDGQGYENADKCAWVFNATSLTTLSNGAKFKVQGNWSNAAYNAGTGYANSSGQKGCIN